MGGAPSDRAPLITRDEPSQEKSEPPKPYMSQYHPNEKYDDEGKLTESEQIEFDGLIGGLVGVMCANEMQMQSAQHEIKEQKAVQELTGTLDVTKVNNAGVMIIRLTEKQKQLIAVFNDRVDHEFNAGEECN